MMVSSIWSRTYRAQNQIIPINPVWLVVQRSHAVQICNPAYIYNINDTSKLNKFPLISYSVHFLMLNGAANPERTQHQHTHTHLQMNDAPLKLLCVICLCAAASDSRQTNNCNMFELKIENSHANSLFLSRHTWRTWCTRQKYHGRETVRIDNTHTHTDTESQRNTERT